MITTSVERMVMIAGLAIGLWSLHGCDFQSQSVPQVDGDDSIYVNSIGVKFRRVPAGTFQMGSTDGDDDERPVHEVEITESFSIGVREVTQSEWNALMVDNPSYFEGPQRPVERVTWPQVQAFIDSLNRKEETGRYRLPTEAEWEYAVRAGSDTRFHFGEAREELTSYAWYSANSEERSHRAGGKKGNSFGLHDMYGNVWEWTRDTYDAQIYEASGRVDPVNTSGGRYSPRVIRGGGWYSVASNMRSANRGWARPRAESAQLGFRLVREPAPNED